VLTNALEELNLRWMSDTTTVAGAWSVSALLLAIAHPAPTLVAGLHFLSAGLLLDFAYLVSGRLGLPIGFTPGSILFQDSSFRKRLFHRSLSLPSL